MGSMPKQKIKKPVVRGRVDSNVFAVIGVASSVLKKAGQREQAKEMQERVVHEAHNYDDALAIIQEYVDFDLNEDAEDDDDDDDDDDLDEDDDDDEDLDEDDE